VDEHNLDESEKVFIEKLFSNLTASSETVFKEISKRLTFPTLIQIERNTVTLDIGGLILDIDKIKKSLDLIGQITESIEREPRSL